MSPMRPTCSAASGGRSRRPRRLAEYQRFELEATYLTLTANVVTAAIQEASLRGQIEATERDHQGGNRSARRRAQSVRGRRRQPRRRADAGIRSGDHAGDAAAAAKAARAAAPCAARSDRPLPERECTARTCDSSRCICRRQSAGKPADATGRAASRRARRAGAIASGQRPDRRRHRQQAAAIHPHR